MRKDLQMLALASACIGTQPLYADQPEQLATPQAHQNLTSEDGQKFIAQNNEVILSVKLRDKVTLSDAIIAYVSGEDFEIPLEQIMLMLEFPIQEKSGGAQGWFIKESRTFSLDKNAGKVVSDGKVFSFNPSQLRYVEGELYVPATLLSQWLPLDLKGNLRALSLNIIPREPIPIDSINERLQRKFGSAVTLYARNPEHHTPYQVLGIPSLDVNFSINQASSDLRGSYAIRASTDLAKMGAEFTLLGNQEELTDGRLNLSRRNPRGNVLEKLDASLFEVGDISSRSIPLIKNSTGGRGVHLERRPEGYVGAQETVSLEGPLETNFEVELYRNDILINAVRSGSASTYDFKNIRLFNGQNELRLEFYGPQGQRRTETKRYFMGENKLKSGELQYDIALSQPGRTTLDIKESGETADTVAGTLLLEYGINNRTSVSGGLSEVALDSSESRRYAFAGSDMYFGGYLVSGDLALNDKGDSAISLGVSTNLNTINLSGSIEKFSSDFSLNSASYENTTDSDDTINSNHAVSSRFDVGINTHSDDLIKGLIINNGIELSWSNYYGGKGAYSIGALSSASYKNIYLNQSLKFSSSPSGTNTGTGSTQLSFHALNTSFKGTIDYNLSPTWEVNSLGVSASKTMGNGYHGSFDYKENYSTKDKSFSASLSKAFKHFSLGLSATHSLEEDGSKDNSLLLTASFNTFTDPKGLKTYFSGSSDADTGAVRAYAFLDENQNGLWDDIEAGVPDIEFSNNNPDRSKSITGADGSVLLRNIPTNDWYDIHARIGESADPTLRNSTKGLSVLARPGVVSKISLPIITTADIEGTISLKRSNGETTPAGNIEVQAVRKNPKTKIWEVIATAISAFDGFYSMPGVPTGDVTLRVNPEQISRLAIVGFKSIPLTLKKDSLFVSDQNFILTR